MLYDHGIGDVREIYPRIIAPALILKADTDRDTRRKNLRTAALLPNGKLVHVDGAGHLVRLDRPDETERHIRVFLATLESP